jgi:SAM-dependent methyltransferase/LPS sulfotransferase NodH
MSANKTQEIIKRAMADRRVYEAMAARENEIWGKMLPDRDRSEAAIEATEASATLGICRNQSSLFRVANEKKLKFEHGLTLGCGTGRRERELISRGVCRSFHGIDISEKAIAAARKIAKEQDLPLTYEVADLNFVEFPEKTFDLVVAQTSLHHVLFLERVAEQVWRSLKSDGYFWIHDFIGETQGQHDPKRLSIMNRILEILPEKFRKNKITGRLIAEIKRPEPGHLASPFEAIRSGEIVPVFQRWFTIEWKMEFDAFLHLVVSPGTRAAYLENEDTKALFEILMLLDHLCIEEKIVQPVGGQYLMRPRSVDEIPREKHNERITPEKAGLAVADLSSKFSDEQPKTKQNAPCASMISYRDNVYMITCPARSGSGMLVNLLRSHPDICSHGEVFSPNKITGITGTYLWKSRDQPGFLEQLSEERDRDPLKFLYKIVLDLQGKKAVCFKLKHNELVQPEFGLLRNEIINDRDFRIIHLRRENLLRRYLSHYIASRVTGIRWVVQGQTVPELQPLTLDPSECQKNFETILRREKEFAELFAQHPSFSISYEEMVTPGGEKIQSLLDFIGVSRRELTTATLKLARNDLRQAIANFEELRDYFASSPYFKFFEDA